MVNVAKAVTRPIAQTIGYTGTVQPADTVSVVPVTSGQIVALKVDVGSTVKTGDIIAQLDSSTLTAQVGHAQAGVNVASVKLAQILAGARPEAVAVAQANVDTAQSKLDAIQAGGRPEAVGEAQANLDTANSKLAAILAGPRPENVANAKANLDSAKSKLKQLMDGPTPDQVAASKLSVEQAKNLLYSSQITREGTCGKASSGGCQAGQATVNASQSAVVPTVDCPGPMRPGSSRAGVLPVLRAVALPIPRHRTGSGAVRLPLPRDGRGRVLAGLQ